jgi:hypothetical protein
MTADERKILDKCQQHLLDLQIELFGYSALFKNMSDCELTADELHGMGLSLEKMAREISVNLDRLSAATGK